MLNPQYTLREHLIARKACRKALKWLGDRDLQTAWDECPNGDWMAWACKQMAYNASSLLDHQDIHEADYYLLCIKGGGFPEEIRIAQQKLADAIRLHFPKPPF